MNYATVWSENRHSALLIVPGQNEARDDGISTCKLIPMFWPAMKIPPASISNEAKANRPAFQTYWEKHQPRTGTGYCRTYLEGVFTTPPRHTAPMNWPECACTATTETEWYRYGPAPRYHRPTAAQECQDTNTQDLLLLPFRK